MLSPSLKRPAGPLSGTTGGGGSTTTPCHLAQAGLSSASTATVYTYLASVTNLLASDVYRLRLDLRFIKISRDDETEAMQLSIRTVEINACNILKPSTSQPIFSAHVTTLRYLHDNVSSYL